MLDYGFKPFCQDKIESIPDPVKYISESDLISKIRVAIKVFQRWMERNNRYPLIQRNDKYYQFSDFIEWVHNG